MKFTRRLLTDCLGAALVGLGLGCGAHAQSARDDGGAGGLAVADASIAAHRVELLDTAFSAATLLPIKPLIRDRSRAQQRVADACLEINLPRRALGFVERIDNWLRGSGYADIASYLAQHGDTKGAERCLELASKVAQTTDDWQRDRLRIQVANGYLLLGRSEEASRFATGVPEAETTRLARTKAKQATPESFDELIAPLAQGGTSPNLDIARGSIEALAELFDRFYADQAKRDRSEESIRSAWKAIPPQLRLELLMKLAQSALQHADQKKALALIDDATAFLKEVRWLPEDHIALIARLAALRCKAGDAATARNEAARALSTFDSERERISDVDRAGALRPLAEAYAAMGDAPTALAVYRRAIEEGAHNPNSRPRAEDLAATCTSLALSAVEPDAALWARIREIHRGLGVPW